MADYLTCTVSGSSPTSFTQGCRTWNVMLVSVILMFVVLMVFVTVILVVMMIRGCWISRSRCEWRAQGECRQDKDCA